MTFDRKWVLSVACGKSQESLLRTARKLGYSIIGVDQSPISEFLDIAIPLSTHDTDKVLVELASGNFPKFDGVICRSSGFAVKTANAIAEAYSLPRAGNLVSSCSISKSFLHDCLVNLGLKTIPIFIARPNESRPAGWDKMVVKPSQSLFGKKNVFLISDDESYATSVAAACNESMDGCAVVQPFIPGRDIGLVTLSQHGNLVWSTFFEEINDLTCGVVKVNGVSAIKRPLSHQQEKCAITFAKKVINESESSGFIFFSFRVKEFEDPLIYEINPGLCGDHIADILLPAMYPSSDFFEIEVRVMTGSEVKFPKLTCNTVTVCNGKIFE
jgi:hypothetical protein